MSTTTDRVIRRHIVAWNDRDTAADPWSHDAEMIAPGGARISGRDGVLAFEQGFWTAFPDARLEILVLICDGARAAGEGRLRGTHRGPLRTPEGEVAPTGRSVDLRWMAMYEVRGEELASEHLYFDRSDFLAQLGLTS